MEPALPRPPTARRVPFVHVAHGDERIDEYHWLRERSDPEVIAHLEAENAYTEAVMTPTRELQETLYQEIVSRIQETDMSVPVRRGPWCYWHRTVEGLQYPLYCRRPVEAEAEAILLDQNAEAAGHPYFALGALEVSPDHRLLAYSVDTEGDEVHRLRIRDLEMGQDLSEEIPGTGWGAAWASDNATVFYTTLDEAKRPYRLWRHRVGTDPAGDELVHQEDDEHFYCSVHRTRSGGFVVLEIASQMTSEVWVLPAGEPQGTFSLVEPRRHGVEYSLEHHQDRFFVLTNEEAPNFKLMAAPVSGPERANWTEVIAHRPDVRLEGAAAFADHLVVVERAEAVRRLRVRRLSSGEEHLVPQDEPVYSIGVSEADNPEFDTAVLRYTYTSLVTPRSVYDHDLGTGERTLLKREPVLGGFDPARYETGRLWAKASDGSRVPISYVCRRDTARDGTAPVLLYGYGAYESCVEPRFSSLRLSLLDRGVVFAIAHVRGGGELGRAWYEDGKLHNKPNTFTDFVACAEHLVAEGWTSPGRVVALGGSAGGLLVGAALNLRPDLFRGVVAEVPFVDVVTTILDPTLPLSVIEWEEWGDPNDPDYYRAMKAYSPYDNVAARPYPAVLATAGLNDPRVSYWEPAKWVARLRERTTGTEPILLKTELGAGHGGPSGRYDAWRHDAFVYAFVLTSLGISA